MLLHPIRYIQRCVDQLTFSPTGGHLWARTLQVRIPETAKPVGRSRRIISLGQYERRRFPDFSVIDSSGQRLNLLTRHHHGQALGEATLALHVDSLPQDEYRSIEGDEEARLTYNQLRDALYGLYTLSGRQADRTTAREITGLYRHILQCVGIVPDAGTSRIHAFADDLAQALDATRYLCWVEAKAGEVVNLQVLYSTKDTKQELQHKSFRKSWSKVRRGFKRKNDQRRATWANWYREFGLAPLNYAFDVPNHRHIGSYYFTIDPPAASDVTYLDWEVGNSLEDRELDSAFFSAHIHNHGEHNLPISGDTIRAYIRCAPHHHKQILGVTLINLALVYLLAKGLLLGELANSAQGALLAAPPILIAYLVQQQRHYYAHAIRRQRAILWIYLLISVIFSLTVAFSHRELGHQNPGWPATVIALLLTASSVGVLIWYLPLGYSYQTIVASFAQRKLRKLEAMVKRRLQVIGTPLLWQCYADTVHKYCTWIFRLAIVAMIGVTASLGVFWHSF